MQNIKIIVVMTVEYTLIFLKQQLIRGEKHSMTRQVGGCCIDLDEGKCLPVLQISPW